MTDEKHVCLECGKPATWLRVTQFAGVHHYCTECAQKEEDFGKSDDSYFFWDDLSLPDVVQEPEKPAEEKCECCEIKDPKSLALYWVVRLADMPETVRAGIKEGADPNFVHCGFSLLATAIWYEKFENAAVLIDLGSDAFFINDHGGNMIALAAQKGSEKLVIRLKALGVDPKMKDKDGDDALACALAFGHEHLRKVLS